MSYGTARVKIFTYGGREKVGADTQVTLEDCLPKTKVLLPERKVQTKHMRIVIVHHLNRSGIAAYRKPGNHVQDGVTWHEARNHPVDGNSDKEG